jgi:hypothetical protein
MAEHNFGGVASAIGSVPHRDARAAAEFALASSPELVTIPSLPKRSPAESMIAQAVVGIRGVGLGQYGSIVVDPSVVDPLAPVVTDLHHDAFVGLRAFLDAADGRTGAIKWQFTGPVTLGLSLVRVGVPVHVAFDVAVRAVRTHLRNIHDHIATRLPDATQVVFIDEPMLGDLMDESFPIAPDTAIDLMSGAMAVLERDCIVGLHTCSDVDVTPLLAAGPAILSVPVTDSLVDVGPVLSALSSLWCGLVQNGCDAMKLRQQSIVTPACGLALHTEANAEVIMAQVRDIAHRVRTQALATRLTVGA